jgi:hypothetical protein
MKWRGISEHELNEVLSAPDEVIDSIRGRKKARKRISGRDIEIVFKEEDVRVVIVTAIDKSR